MSETVERDSHKNNHQTGGELLIINAVVTLGITPLIINLKVTVLCVYENSRTTVCITVMISVSCKINNN